jgi:hypothetical protein
VAMDIAEKIRAVLDEVAKISNSSIVTRRAFQRFSIFKNRQKIEANPRRIARSFGFNWKPAILFRSRCHAASEKIKNSGLYRFAA